MTPARPRFDYLARQRHLLMDMHVPDWDDAFMSKVDPAELVESYVRSGADAVMVYCNSHVGDCFYPTKVGHHHAGLAGLDLVGEQVRLLRERDVAVCAYYSSNFNVLAWREHPEWRTQPTAPRGYFTGERSTYAVCCPTNSEYNAFQVAQVEEIASMYEVDAFFFDMVFWVDVCVCDSCRARYLTETGCEIPTTIDWFSADWCRFQDARERWLADQFDLLKAAVKRHRDVPVFLNSTCFGLDWILGASPRLLAANDLLGGDFPGSGDGLFTMASFFAGASSGRFQYMQNISGYGASSTRMRSIGELTEGALAAATFGGQFLAIDAIEADGSLNAPSYDALAEVFAAMRPFEGCQGGAPVADVAVYWSMSSRVFFDANGSPLDKTWRWERTPHDAAVVGAVSAVRQAGLAVGVISERDLADLDRFQVLVLPNVHRLTLTEVAAFRNFVERGGRIYASGYTSLVTTDGSRHADFLLGDLFGVRIVGEELSSVYYLSPNDPGIAAELAPQRYLTVGDPGSAARSRKPTLWRPVLEALPGTEVLATLTQRFGTGAATKENDDWASIHTDLPWAHTDEPMLVRTRHGGGEVVYSAVPIEAMPTQHDGFLQSAMDSPGPKVFGGLVRSLLSRPLSVEVEGHPDVWVVVLDESEHSRYRLAIHNHAPRVPALPIPYTRVVVNPPRGASFGEVVSLPDNAIVNCARTAQGGIVLEVNDLVGLLTFGLPYTTSGDGPAVAERA